MDIINNNKESSLATRLKLDLKFKIIMSILSHVIRNKGANSWKTNRKCFVKRKKKII